METIVLTLSSAIFVPLTNGFASANNRLFEPKVKQDFQIEKISAEIISLNRIWDKAPHNVFTDLIRYKNKFYCVFREGTGHINFHGKIRVIESENGDYWKSVALISAVFADLRDPKLSITNTNELMLLAFGALHPPYNKECSHQSVAFYSKDGSNCTDGIQVSQPNTVLWRVSWNKKKNLGLGFAVNSKEPSGISLYQTKNGRKFSLIHENTSVQL